jgi:hypothetical protein
MRTFRTKLAAVGLVVIFLASVPLYPRDNDVEDRISVYTVPRVCSDGPLYIRKIIQFVNFLSPVEFL